MRRDDPIGPGMVLGVGLGGFFDGIMLHQLLQWHHMLSSTARWPTTTVAGLRANTLADGLFHGFTLAVTLAGLGWLWRLGRRPHGPWSTNAFVGSLSFGWGLFNVVEGLVDHELLGIHHVRSGAHHVIWDMLYLAWGAAMFGVGAWLMRAGAREAGAAEAEAEAA